MKCGPKRNSTTSPNKLYCNEEKFGFGWKSVAIGYGCGMVLGKGLGCCMLLIGKPRWPVMMASLIQILERLFGRLNKIPLL
ncbi:transmembrane protein, putative [Medicago truncatula]|uniref:Transmembrane protein, putative n=1 Tax=Medicago truncatula TaxID=3880 RepID=G7IP88_MEDTR|nr:transmembrane protein, putative [Medicago truncatula]